MHRPPFVPRIALALLGAAALVAAACDQPAEPTGGGTLRIMLTDAPRRNVEQVNIYFTSVTVKPMGRGIEQVDLALPQNPIDLLTLHDQVVALAAAAVGSGAYDFIQINVDPAQSAIVVDGQSLSLRVPSRDVKVLRPFSVDEGGETTITLDFDAERSLVSLGNGQWLLTPQIVVSDIAARPGS
jgi:hypothetical protein